MGRFDSEPQLWYGLLKLIQLSRYFKYRGRYSTSLPWLGTALIIVSNGYTACNELCSRIFSCFAETMQVCLLVICSAIQANIFTAGRSYASSYLQRERHWYTQFERRGLRFDLGPKTLKYSYI